jgi:hypothetical protein
MIEISIGSAAERHGIERETLMIRVDHFEVLGFAESATVFVNLAECIAHVLGFIAIVVNLFAKARTN